MGVVGEVKEFRVRKPTYMRVSSLMESYYQLSYTDITSSEVRIKAEMLPVVIICSMTNVFV